MNKFILFLVLATTCLSGYSQHEEITKHWETYHISDDETGPVTYQLYKNGIDKTKPLLLFLEGSGNFPLYHLKPNGEYRTTTTLDFKTMSNDFHIVVINKPGTPFVDRIQTAPSGRKYYPVNDTYRKQYSLDWRARAGDLVITDMLQKGMVDPKKIIVWGHSEEAQVAPAVAARNKKVTHVVAMMGNALNHLYDFLIMERLAAIKGEISNEDAQARIDSLFTEFEKIYHDPGAIDKEWFGETYYKWSSFTKTSPVEHMLQLEIPILYVAGGADTHQNIINMDFARLEFIRKGKKNLTYKVFPRYDHFFMEVTTDATGKSDWKDHLDEVNRFALDWIDKN